MKAPNKRLRKAALYLLTPITGSLVGAGAGYLAGSSLPEGLRIQAHNLQYCVDSGAQLPDEALASCPGVMMDAGIQNSVAWIEGDPGRIEVDQAIKDLTARADRLAQNIPRNIFQGTAAGFLLSTGAILLDMRRPDSAPPVQAQQVTS